jgi:hypothetical protein
MFNGFESEQFTVTLILVRDRVLRAWRDLKADARQRIIEVERKQKTMQEGLDRLERSDASSMDQRKTEGNHLMQ